MGMQTKSMQMETGDRRALVMSLEQLDNHALPRIVLTWIPEGKWTRGRQRRSFFECGQARFLGILFLGL